MRRRLCFTALAAVLVVAPQIARSWCLEDCYLYEEAGSGPVTWGNFGTVPFTLGPDSPDSLTDPLADIQWAQSFWRAACNDPGPLPVFDHVHDPSAPPYVEEDDWINTYTWIWDPNLWDLEFFGESDHGANTVYRYNISASLLLEADTYFNGGTTPGGEWVTHLLRRWI